MDDWGMPTIQPCGRAHEVCDECSRVRLNRILADSKRVATLNHLLNKVNAVTAPHRHGQPVSKRRLDDLANAQLEYEEAERHE